MPRWTRAGLVPVLVLASVVVAAPPAVASPEADLVSRINAERRAQGLRTLVVKGDLTAVAERHSARMASRKRVYHNPSLGGEVGGWTVIGENVGSGTSVSQIHRAFMRSSSHRAVILNPKYNQVGVGVTMRGGTLYVSEVFVKRGSTTVSKPATKTVSRIRVRATRSSSRTVAVVRARPVRTEPPARPEAVTVELLVRMMGQDDDVGRVARFSGSVRHVG